MVNIIIIIIICSESWCRKPLVTPELTESVALAPEEDIEAVVVFTSEYASSICDSRVIRPIPLNFLVAILESVPAGDDEFKPNDCANDGSKPGI